MGLEHFAWLRLAFRLLDIVDGPLLDICALVAYLLIAD